jgi:hypothetical protein
MLRPVSCLLILALSLAACGAPAPTPLPTRSESFIPDTETPLPPPIETLTPSITPTVPTSTPAATATETLLPTLELPTLATNPPAAAVWDGLPTYLADSQPGYYFRLRYDPEVWALVSDQFGQPALAHRRIQYCTITPASGRGLPQTMQVEHDILYEGKLTLNVSRVYENGVLKLTAYQISDGTIFTGFEVGFVTEGETCDANALVVLKTMESVPISQATPLVTPQP